MKSTRLLPFALAMLCTAALAQEAPRGERPQGDGPRGIARFDTNGDGVLTRDELKDNPRMLERFDELDSNGDGHITEEELRAGMRPRGQEGGPPPR